MFRINKVLASTLAIATLCFIQGCAQPTKPPQIIADQGLRVELEPAAISILKEMGAKLTQAKSLSFSATATYESTARTGQPLAYLSQMDVSVKRPNMLSVITLGDGPRSEFYFNGESITAYSPAANVVATAKAPDSINEMLKFAFQKADIYFPFTDVIVADPYAGAINKLKIAFVVGQSVIVGGITTDVIALVNDNMQAQIWIGRDDKLPRLLRVTYFNEPGNFRHVVSFSNWKLNPTFTAKTFTNPAIAQANKIEFASPSALAQEVKTPAGAKP